MIGDAITTQHLEAIRRALHEFEDDAWRLQEWGIRLAAALTAGQRLLVAGNGGSAAEAQHLAAELVGRLDGERAPLPALALHAETSSLTAIANDYGYAEVFARQVRAHGRPGDIVLSLSTSGASPNLLAAARAAREIGALAWALTGSLPNPLAGLCDEVVAMPSDNPQTVQEMHLMCVHLLCRHVDLALAATARRPAAPVIRPGQLARGAP